MFWMDLMETKACILEHICLEAPESIIHKWGDDKTELIEMDMQVPVVNEEEGYEFS